MDCIFSVDVEDWFHILDLPHNPDISEWDRLPSLVEKNLITLLDLFDSKGVKVTCFFLGWVAEKFPRLVKEASSRGHEIASHGYTHQLLFEMTPQAFFEDALKSKHMLEDIIGQPIYGYRASGFSVTEKTPFFFEELTRAGYRYSSSIWPGIRGHGGMQTNQFAPHYIRDNSSSIIEFPISLEKIFGLPICFFGGGYLRLFPFSLIQMMSHKVLKDNRPVIFYVHPREIDPNHPRLSMNLKRKFQTYFNISTTEKKIKRIIDTFSLISFQKYIAKYYNNLLEDS